MDREDIPMAPQARSGRLGQEQISLCQKPQVHQHLWQERGRVSASTIGGYMRKEEGTRETLGFLPRKAFRLCNK